MSIEEFETDRLIMKSTKKEDTTFCLDMWLDDEMGKYLSDPPRDKAGDTYLKWKEDIEIYDGCYYFIAISKETGDYIGACSTVPSEDNKHWDLGYSVHKKYWKQGYGTEMINGLIKFCYINGGRKITADVAKENAASNALLRKLKFHIEKEGTFKKNGTDIIYEDYTYRLDLN